MQMALRGALSRKTSIKPTELHLAIINKNLDALRKRLKSKAAKAEVLMPDSQDRIPLVAAIQANLPLLVEELLRFYQEFNTPINYTDSHGNTALHCACQEPLLDERIITGLLKHPGIDVRAQNVDGNTPMHFFCERFSSPLCQEYIDRFVSMGADVNAANNYGETLLHKACLNNRIRLLLVELLLGKGADPNKLNKNGEGPLHFAVRMSREDLVTVLLKQGADVNVRDRRENKKPSEFAHKNPRILNRLRKVEDLWAWLEHISSEIYDLYRVKFCSEELFLDVMPMAHDKMLEKMGVKLIHRQAILSAAAKIAKADDSNAAGQSHQQTGQQGGQQQQLMMNQSQQSSPGGSLTSACSFVAPPPQQTASTASLVGYSSSASSSLITKTQQQASSSPSPPPGGAAAAANTSSPTAAAAATAAASSSSTDPTTETKVADVLAKLGFPLPEKWVIPSTAIEWTKRAGASKERERIGEGANAKVFRAIMNGKDDVAVKILKPMEAKEAADFAKEFEIMCVLRHPYIVRFYGCCLNPLSLVMEFCSKGTLYEVLNNESLEIGWARSLIWCIEFTSAMVFVHNSDPQVLHRDFKSLNILVTRDWQCRVSDFGLSRFNNASSMATLTQGRGTLTHMAPEVCSAMTNPEESANGPNFVYSVKSDMYSMGIVLWEVFHRCVDAKYSKPWFGEFPALAGLEFGIIFKVQQGIRPGMDASPLNAPVPGTVPPSVQKLYREAVAADRNTRPTAEQLLEQLKELQKEYQADPATWDKYCKPLPQNVQLQSTRPDHVNAAAATTTTSPCPPAVTPVEPAESSSSSSSWVTALPAPPPLPPPITPAAEGTPSSSTSSPATN